MQFWVKVLLVVVLSTVGGSADAQLYRYVDAETGWFVYSNRKFELPVQTRIAAPPSLLRASLPGPTPILNRDQNRSMSTKSATARYAPADFPRVTRSMQQERDSDRRRILQDELDAEKLALNAALGKGAAEDIVHQHRANVAALERELGRTR
jgi:hypothetical protein